MDLQQVLIQNGLSDKQASIYLACLKLGTASVVEIANATKIKRPTCYLGLEELISKGLMNKQGDKAARYQAEDPKVLLFHVEQNQRQLQQTLPDLQRLQRVSVSEVIQQISGEQIFTVMREIVNSSKLVYWFLDLDTFDWSQQSNQEIISVAQVKILVNYTEIQTFHKFLLSYPQKRQDIRRLSTGYAANYGAIFTQQAVAHLIDQNTLELLTYPQRANFEFGLAQTLWQQASLPSNN